MTRSRIVLIILAGMVLVLAGSIWAVFLRCSGARVDEGFDGAVYLSFQDGVLDLGSHQFAAVAVGDEVRIKCGVNGRAAFIGGTEDWIEIAIAKPVSLAEGATLELWLRRDDWLNPYKAGSGVQTVAAVDGLVLNIAPGSWSLQGSVGSSQGRVRVTSEREAITAKTWFHVALVYEPDTSSTRLYLDGRMVGESTETPIMPTKFVNPFKIGTWYRANQAYRGFVDEVKLYDYPRTAEQVTEAAQPG